LIKNTSTEFGIENFEFGITVPGRNDIATDIDTVELFDLGGDFYPFLTSELPIANSEWFGLNDSKSTVHHFIREHPNPQR
jgi:hypothetical protein